MKVTPVKSDSVKVFKTKADKTDSKEMYQWWKSASNEKEMCRQLLSTVAYLKENQSDRQRQAALFARLYGNMSLYSFVGTSMDKLDKSTGLPVDRPTFNLVQSAIDTLVSRIGQNKPSPVFLTDGSNYKERKLAKQLNDFIGGELYQTRAYEKAVIMLRDALVEGTGILKVYETEDARVGLDRVLLTELFVDLNESLYGEPRQIYQMKLMDRQVLMDLSPEYKRIVKEAEGAFANDASDTRTVSDMVLVVEGWHLPSSKGAKDGRHTIACSSGILVNEEYTKDKFPFVFLHYSPRMLGFWAQGVAEQLMGTQLEINSLLYTISRAIKLVGVPRVFVEEGSKVMSTAFNNDIGSIIKYRGIKPVYEVAPAVPQEMYAQLERLIQQGYQQCGVSAMQAGAQKPSGLNSGEAQRVYDDISTDRFATLSKRYDNVFVDLAYLIIDLAMDIAKRDGKYQTIYPNKDGTKQIDLPKMDLIKDPFVIQCFNMSSLPKDPAGRMQKIVEMIQSGMITIKEGRRLLDYPDLGQQEKLANASEERIYYYLDKIVDEGEYNGPDPFMDLQLANEIVVQYYNLYEPAKLEEERCEMLRTFYKQIQAITQAAMPPAPQPVPQATPQPLPQSPLVPNAVPQAA